MKMLKLKSIAGLVIGACMGFSAAAAPVHFAGTGVWGATVASTAYSAANATFAFAFDLPNPVSNNPTTQISGFSYLLNGVSIGQTASAITFYDASTSGLFDINFGSSAVSLYGPQIFDFTANTISLGTFAATVAPNDAVAVAGSTGSVTVTPVATVPEPGSLALAALALASMGALARRKSA